MLFVLSMAVKAQYTTYKMDNVGSISISDDMELQSGDYREMTSELHQKILHINPQNRIVFQPKGLNEFQKESKEVYVRIIINTLYGEYESLSNDKSQISVEELQELNKIYKELAIRESQIFEGGRLIYFHGVSVESVNNQVCTKWSYTRQYNNEPIVKVEVYDFLNKDRAHRLIFSYRASESHLWKYKLKNTLNSLKITRIN
ncbi:hypothetical protein [Capnocytophaga cynodegmi]|uniref:hypothetical protein n=1 Tax=Capnocytophaga cynodegmi TaxID=28189 RepID=UPI00386B99A3